LRWYINPIVDQQNDFNASVSRAFVRLSSQQEALAQIVADLEQRLAALEAATRHAAPGSPAGATLPGEPAGDGQS
jgi:hypothetical protein